MGRYLALGETTGTAWCPDWYLILRACDRLHCTPWELLEQSIYWRDVALKAISGENRAAKIRQDLGL